MAQRLAKMTLFRAREQMTLTADFGMEAFEVQVGDIVGITNSRYGWTAKEFEVVGWKFGNNGAEGEIVISLTLRETSSAAFDWNAEESDITDNDSTLPNAGSNLTISSLVNSGGGRTTSDGTFINSVIVSWTAPSNPFISFYEVEHKATADSNYAATTTSETSIELSPLVDGVEYTIRVRAVTISGVRGPYVTATFTGGGDTTAPSLPTAISATGGFKYVTINWTNPADADLNFVEIYENTSNTSTGATKVGISAGDTFTRTNLGLNQTRYYFLKSVDFSGNASAFTSGVSATTTFLDDADFENGVRQLFIDQGKDIIEPVASLPVSGDYTNQQVFLTSTGELYYWDGSSWQNTVASAGSVAFSDLTGTIGAAQIVGQVVAANNIVSNSIDAGQLAASGVITSAAMINDAVIENAKIKNAAVDTLKVAGNSVTITNNASYSTVNLDAIQTAGYSNPANGKYNFTSAAYFASTGRMILVANVGFFGTATSGDTLTLNLYMNTGGSSTGGTLVRGITFTGVSLAGLHTLVGEFNVTSTGWFYSRLEVSNMTYITNPSANCDMVQFLRFR
jgi:hypothetical protein